MPVESRPKKQISEKRRQQNKQAQKNYRERQKRKLEALQGVAGSRNGFLLQLATNRDRTLDPDYCSCTVSSVGGSDGVLNSSLAPQDPQIFLDVNSMESSTGSADPSASALFRHGHVENYGVIGSLHQQEEKQNTLEAEGGAVLVEDLPEVFCPDSASNLCGGRCDSKSPQLRTDKILLLQYMNRDALPDIRRNNIRIKQVLFTAACLANASALGFSSDSATCDNAESPFFRRSVSEDVAKAACLSSFNELKECLRPCVTQMMYSHHPYIDVLPFPTFRERIIKLAYIESPMIDEDDLGNDLQNDGLICWGSSLGGGSVATGSGAPWDIRSWEAQPWFLRKWWILIGGVEGEIYKQTQWWREMRGERSCQPW